MKILVTGANGQLGQALIDQGRYRGLQIIPCDLPHLDVTRPDQLNQALSKTSSDLVINAAAYTNVDGAEANPETAFAVNRDGPGCIADA